MQLTDKDGNVYGWDGLEITTSSGKPKVPVINTDITIGTTAVIGGVSGRVLYNNAGVVGELDLSSIYVPTSRTLTINGVTQDLSANRTFTISTGITIGSTAIASGTVGRVLFQGTGNVVQQSSSLFWDAPNDRLIVGSTGSSGVIAFPTTISGFSPIIQSQFAGNNIIFSIGGRNFTISGSGTITTNFNTTIIGSTGSAALVVAQGNSAWSPVADFNSSSGTALRINTNGNVLIGTTTDAGFKLDVNGTARVQGNAQFGTGFYWDNTNNRLGIGTPTPATALDLNSNFTFNTGVGRLLNIKANSGPTVIAGFGTGINFGLKISSGIVEDVAQIDAVNNQVFRSSDLIFRVSQGSTPVEAMRINYLGGVQIGTTTNAGYKLDVNGTARVTTRIDAGSFTPGAGASAYTIATTGRISAGNGISFRSPIVGDSIFVGLSPASGHSQIEIYTSGNRCFVFGGSGGDTAPMANATANFNPSSGTGDKAIFQVSGQYWTSGTYSGAIRGFYYNPTLTSMTGVTAHWAIHTTSGRIRFENLPTSSAGLSAGDIWNDGGTLKIV